jgi:hypothetical protein
LLVASLVGCDPCVESIYAHTDSDLAALAGCETIEGDLTIGGGGELTNLDSLSNLTTVTGDLDIINTTLSNLDGLANVSSVRGSLFLRDNDALSNISGLSSLNPVGGDVHIYYNVVLTSIDGFSSLTQVGGDLMVHDNPVLCQSSVDAFAAGATIGGWVNTYRNDTGC